MNHREDSSEPTLPAAASPTPASVKRPWSEPSITELPPLTELTLQSGLAPEGDAITGSGGSGGLSF